MPASRRPEIKTAFWLIVITRLQKINPSFAHAVHQAVFLGDPARPATGENIFQWLRLSNADKWLAQYGFDKFESATGNFSICFYPIAQILPKLGMKYSFPFEVRRQVLSPGGISPNAPACLCGSLLVVTRLVTFGHFWVTVAGGPFP